MNLNDGFCLRKNNNFAWLICGVLILTHSSVLGGPWTLKRKETEVTVEATAGISTKRFNQGGKLENAGSKSNSFTLQTDVEYGANDDFTVGLKLPYQVTKLQENSSNRKSAGFSNLKPMGRLALMRTQNSILSLETSIIFPSFTKKVKSPNPSLGQDYGSFETRLMYGYSENSWFLSLEPGIRFNGLSKSNEILGDIAAGYKCTEYLELILQFFNTVSTEIKDLNRDYNSHTISPCVYFKVTKNLKLKASVDYTFMGRNTSQDKRVTIGVVWNF